MKSRTVIVKPGVYVLEEGHRTTHTPSNSWWLHDARGIPCARVCSAPGCIEEVKGRYRPEIFEDPGYETCEQVDPDDYSNG